MFEPPQQSESNGASRRRLVVVSYLANQSGSPRGIRTRAFVSALERDWRLEVIAGPSNPSGTRSGPDTSLRLRRLVRWIHSSVLLDKFEFWSVRRFRSWRPLADGALLIGFPFSPLAHASRQLVAARIPYVVDIGDPWALTASQPTVRLAALARARWAEHRMWKHAAAAIVTTGEQADALREYFPRLTILVRPNGFDALTYKRPAVPRPVRRAMVLQLAHFGSLYQARIDPMPFLKQLAASSLWGAVEFHQYGPDYAGLLHASPGVRVVFHEERPWQEIVDLSLQFDAAVVIGNRDGKQLPSKAVDYLLLPVPRLAITREPGRDALSRYVADKPAWLILPPDAPNAADLVERHVTRTWPQSELAPPAEEAWDAVAEEMRRFVKSVIPESGASGVSPPTAISASH